MNTSASEQGPILSICIPTYNRARLLEGLLRVLEPEVRPFRDRVEVVVSDNNSPDSTPDVVQAAKSRMPIVYRRLSQNLGGLYNIVTVVTEVAHGKYCIVLGDDDLVRPGLVKKLLETFDRNPGIPGIFVNHTYEPNEERNKYDGLTETPVAFDEKRLLCRNTQEGLEEAWERIIFHSEVPALYTSLVSHVFLREIWIRQAPSLGSLESNLGNLVLRYEMVFPHVHMLAAELTGKPAVYIGYPYVMFFVGAQEWLGIWKKYLFTFVLRIADQIESFGGLRAAAEQYRKLVFLKGASDFRNLLFHQKAEMASGADWTKWKFTEEDDFSFWRLTRRNWRQAAYWGMVRWAFAREVKERFRQAKAMLRQIPLAYRVKKKIDAWRGVKAS